MGTLYYHAGAGAAAAARGLGVLDVRGDDRGLAPCRAPASRTPALADFVFSALQLYFNFTASYLLGDSFRGC